MARSNESLEGATIYCTHTPCTMCAKLLYQCGIKRFVYTHFYRDYSGIRFLDKMGVKVDKYNENL